MRSCIFFVKGEVVGFITCICEFNDVEEASRAEMGKSGGVMGSE